MKAILSQFGDVKSIPSVNGESWVVRNIEIFLNHNKGTLKAMNLNKGSIRLEIKNFTYSDENESILIQFIKDNLDNKIVFDIKDLKQGILKPTCTCGNKDVQCFYDGEYSEDYTFYCSCGAKDVISGYTFDSLLD